MKTLIFSLLVVIFGIFSISAYSKSNFEKVLEGRWRKIESNEFIIISNTNENKIKEIATELSYFKSIASIVSSTDFKIEKKPILFLLDSKSFRTITKNKKKIIGGYFKITQNRDYAMMNSSKFRRSGQKYLIFHEYTHYLQSLNNASISPAWYREGVAEYLGAVKIKDSSNFTIGLVSNSRIKYLGYYSWENIRKFFHKQGSLLKTARNDTHDRYGQALVMIHYFLNNPARNKNLSSYLKNINNGLTSEQAFNNAFPISLEDLNKEVKKYLKRGKYSYNKIKLNSPLQANITESRRLTKYEISDIIARYLIRRGKITEEEASYYEAQLKDNAISAGGLSVLAFNAMKSEKKYIFDQLKEQYPNDKDSLFQLAHYYYQLRVHSKDNLPIKEMYIEEEANTLRAILKIDQRDPRAAFDLGINFRDSGKNLEMGRKLLETAYFLKPQYGPYGISLANAYYEDGMYQEAYAIVKSYLGNRSHLSSNQEFSEWLEKIKSAAEAANEVKLD